jgi:hypothetical protein
MGFRAGLFAAALIIILAGAAHSWLSPALAQAPGAPGEVISSARAARTITPADNTPLALGPTRYIYIGQATACALAVILADDTAAVTLAVPANLAVPFMPLRAKVVMATGTTCTPIAGLW